MNAQVALLDLDLLVPMRAMQVGATTLDAFALGLVVSSARMRLSAMKAALSDPDRMFILAHAFKGVSATCGLGRLASALQRLEDAARQGSGISEALADVEATTLESMRAVDDYLAPSPAVRFKPVPNS